MFNEMYDEVGGVREAYGAVDRWIKDTGLDLLSRRSREAEALFRRLGITFAVYGEGGDPERLIPFDLIPRVFSAAEWQVMSEGIEQRARALNAFLYDVYHRGEIIKAGLIPADLVYNNEAFIPEMCGVEPAGRVYSHIVGVDIVRTGPDKFQVLEDNCRTPSGVSYMLENREIMMRMFPDLFVDGGVERSTTIRRVAQDAGGSRAARQCTGHPTVVLLTPGSLNSAYYEHSFLADRDGRRIGRGAGHLFARTAASGCGPPGARAASTSSTGASTTTLSTRWHSDRTACSACRG
jgi:uncharacterized circularly permuted ATP-grasp superfamily protein